MSYNAFSTILAIRDLPPQELAEGLIARLNGLNESLTGTRDSYRHGISDFALNQFSKRYISYILARMTAYIETKSGMTDRFAEYIGASEGQPYEIEHVLADNFERDGADFDNNEETFQGWRNSFGALVLLPRASNRSFGALPYRAPQAADDKYRHYARENLLTRSLTREAYEREPGFRHFIEETGLQFCAHEGPFNKEVIEARLKLYQSICERIWDPSQLLSELN